MSIIGRAITVGGGSGINLKVVGGTTQPSNPKENTIWVKTSSAVGNVYYTAVAPSSPALNDIWISVHPTYVTRYIPISDKPYTQLPVSFCCQYDGNYWQGKETMVYMNSAWKGLKLLLHQKSLGIGSTSYWSAFATQGNYASTQNLQAPTFESSENGLAIKQVSSRRGTAVYGTSSADTIDFSKYSQISMVYYSSAANYRELCVTQTWPDLSGKYTCDKYIQKNNSSASTTTEMVLDTSDITTSEYVAVGILNSQTVTIFSLVLYPVQ